MVKLILKLDDNTKFKNIEEIKMIDSRPISLKSMKSSAQNFKIEEIEKNYIKEFLKNNERDSDFLYISLWLMLKNFICPKRISDRDSFLLKLFFKAEEIIKSKMDVINYLNILQEFNNTKCLLFDDVHSLCLSFFKKPKLFEKNISTKINSKNHSKLREIIKYFTEKKDISKKDETIFNLLSDDVKNFIKIRMNID